MALIEKIVNKRGFMNIPKQVFKHCTVKLGISPVYKYRQDNNIKYIGDINMFWPTLNIVEIVVNSTLLASLQPDQKIIA